MVYYKSARLLVLLPPIESQRLDDPHPDRSRCPRSSSKPPASARGEPRMGHTGAKTPTIIAKLDMASDAARKRRQVQCVQEAVMNGIAAVMTTTIGARRQHVIGV